MTTPLTVRADLNIPLERIVNSIIGALEGGYSQWLHSFKPDDSADTRAALRVATAENMIWYAREEFWHNGGKAVAIYDLPSDDEGEGNGKMTIGLPELTIGLTTMAAKVPVSFADLINENDDAITHDSFMQMVILGEIVYG